MLHWLPWVRRRRARIHDTPLTADQRAVLARHAGFVERLSGPEQQRLEGLMQLFLYDKRFEGCGGLEMTETIRLTISAHACRLLLGLDVYDPYPGLDVIRVYPSTYRVPEIDRLAGHLIEGGTAHRLGESSHHGFVVLAWDAVRWGAAREHDGHNVVLHEFAHQLDAQDGASDGAPLLERNLYGPWARILGAAFEELQADVASHRRNVIDAYGATNPAEFFAVATETFFERPSALKAQDPRLYRVIRHYYRQDPDSDLGSGPERSHRS